jgi:hypothetical protein
MEKIAEDYSTPYFRFNVQHGLQNMMLDEWTEKKRDVFNEETGRFEKTRMSTLDYLKLATEAYLASTAERASSRDPEVLVQDNIRDSAKLLVEYRRAREVGSGGAGLPNGAVR